uniref:ATP synthase F0 subunit 8 n=1 Tax=Nephotettix virescens TaxID=1032906 RepID=UPI0021D53537|nr:ATP synthase F0 subunit 8 [Nephotettix virescens]UXD78694.1 ATP synthase F0 subunit 8 [Nephotettix virescens]
MPQMSPMWWTMIFFMLISTLLLMMMILYFMFSNKMKTYSNYNKKILHWKW